MKIVNYEKSYCKFLATKSGKAPGRAQKHFFLELKNENCLKNYFEKAFLKFLVVDLEKAPESTRKLFFVELKNVSNENCSIQKYLI